MKHIGYINIGNTCYINSILQCLRVIDELNTNISLANISQSNISKDNPNNILIKEYLNIINSNEKLVNPSKFIKLLFNTQQFSKYKLYEFQDANEFLIDLLDTFHKILEKNINKINIKTRNNKLKLSFDDLFISIKKKYSIIYDIFLNQYSDTIECNQCNNKIYKFDPFMTLDLPIEFRNNVSQLLPIYLNNMFSKTNIEYKCLKCNNTSSTKSTSIWKLGKILIITLKKYHNKIHINIPYKINMSEYFDKDSPYSKLTYSVFGLVYHTGVHYYTTIYNKGKWYLYNDNKYRIIEIDEINNKDIYLIFLSGGCS